MGQRNNGKSPDLLDQLASASGCMYLSDLHQANKLPQVQLAASRCPADNYSVAEWAEAVQYISGQPVSFRSSDEARRYLLGMSDPLPERG